MTRRILRRFSLTKIAAVDRPCQEHALMTIIKRDQTPRVRLVNKRFLEDIEDPLDNIAKAMYVMSSSGSDPDDCAQSFSDVLEENLERQEQNKISDEFWPLFDALRTSVTSIIADSNIEGDDGKLAAIRVSVDQFLSAAAATLPDAQAALEAHLSAQGPAIAKLLKVEEIDEEINDDLQKRIDDLNKRMAILRGDPPPASEGAIVIQLDKLRSRLAKMSVSANEHGNRYHDDHGQFTSGDNLGIGGTGTEWPHIRSNQYHAVNAQLTDARKERDTLGRSGVSQSDPDMLRAHAAVARLSEKLQALEGSRMAALRQLDAGTANAQARLHPSDTGAAYGSQPQRPSYQQQNANRSAEAQRIQDRLQQQRVQDSMAARARVSETEAGSLRRSLMRTTGRLTRSASELTGLVANIHGAATSTDFVRIGSHLNFIRQHTQQLGEELAGLPADAKQLHTEVQRSLKTVGAAVGRAYTALSNKVGGGKTPTKKSK